MDITLIIVVLTFVFGLVMAFLIARDARKKRSQLSK